MKNWVQKEAAKLENEAISKIEVSTSSKMKAKEKDIDDMIAAAAVIEDPAEAAKKYAYALELQENVLGADHIKVIDTLYAYANCLLDVNADGSFGAIYKLFTRCMMGYDVHLQDSGHQKFDVMGAIGTLYLQTLEDFLGEENHNKRMDYRRHALEWFQNALDGYKKLFGTEVKEMTCTLNCKIANVLYDMHNRMDEAKGHYIFAIQGYETLSSGGKKTPVHLNCLFDYARNILYHDKEYQSAYDIFQEIMLTGEEIFGDDAYLVEDAMEWMQKCINHGADAGC